MNILDEYIKRINQKFKKDFLMEKEALKNTQAKGPHEHTGYTCPKCGQHYPVKPKRCRCTPYDVEFDGQTSYYLREPREVIELTKKQYEFFAKEITKIDHDTSYALGKQTSHWGIEIADVNHEEINITREEFGKCKQLLGQE